MALNNPGNGDVPPTSFLRSTMQPDAMANSPASYGYDYTRNCYRAGEKTISASDVCAALAERDALRAENEKLRAHLSDALDYVDYVANNGNEEASELLKNIRAILK